MGMKMKANKNLKSKSYKDKKAQNKQHKVSPTLSEEDNDSCGNLDLEDEIHDLPNQKDLAQTQNIKSFAINKHLMELKETLGEC